MTNWELSGGSVEKIVNLFSGSFVGTSANTKGVWANVSASGEDFDCNGLILSVYSRSWACEALVDIGIGSTPEILINNLQFTVDVIRSTKLCYVPIHIPRNTIIKGRQQSTDVGTNNVSLLIYGLQGGRWQKPLFTKCYTYGADTIDSGGTLVDSGATAYVWGSYVEFVSSLPETIKGFMISVGARKDWGRGNQHWFIDVAKDYGSEETLLDNYIVGCSTGGNIPTPQYSPFFPIKVAKGESIAIRSKCSVNTTDRYFDIVLYCFA